jgi:hypothetical protein
MKSLGVTFNARQNASTVCQMGSPDLPANLPTRPPSVGPFFWEKESPFRLPSPLSPRAWLTSGNSTVPRGLRPRRWSIARQYSARSFWEKWIFCGVLSEIPGVFD